MHAFGMDQMQLCIVDDQKDLTDVYADYLRDSYEVRSFYSATDALAEFDKDYEPDLIVTDIKMPKMDGMQFIDKLREQQTEAPIIIMSAYAEKSHALKAINQQVFGLLEKPFKLEQLRHIIDLGAQHALLNQVSKTLIGNYMRLSQSNFELLSRYRERFQIAENVLFNSDISLHANNQEVKQFLTKIRSETELEKKIELLIPEISALMSRYIELTSDSPSHRTN